MPATPHLREAIEPELSLPGWIYRDPEFFEVEMSRVIRPAWQIVCHANDITAPGDWRTLDYLGESVIVLRGQDKEIRAFHNVCRHRASRIVASAAGGAARLTCPYHAWTYGLDGRLIGIPHREDYPGLDSERLGLVPVELEMWRGFLFVRLESGGPSVAAMMAPYDAEIAPYRFEALEALGRLTLRPRDVNWKNVADNYSDGLHINVAHPGLSRLFGRSYGIEAADFVDRMVGDLLDKPSANVSERAYQACLPEVEHLPDSHRRRWLYFKLWPNLAFDLYPDQVDFMQFLPVSAT
ncbi:MAG: aromatic ring-hydroxylating dioxygenase subunit alpha, partial [Alphaproteobacteria bacterium]|nr:aromatic ring-hydroxylating dioxygenase subunit alpha [Alphaproteobacteria bacterium]